MARSASARRFIAREFNNSLLFSSLAHYVALPASASLKSDIVSQFAAAIWFRPNGLQAGVGSMFLYPTGAFTRCWSLEVSTTNKLSVAISNGTTNQTLTTSASLKNNEWNFLGGQYTAGSQLTNYLNGTYTTTAPTITNTGAAGAIQLHLGNNNASFGPIGHLTRAIVFKNILTQTQWDNLYYNHELPAGVDIAAKYEFTDGSGTTLTDSSGNANNGTISGAVWNTIVPFKARTTTNARSIITTNRTAV